MKLLAIDPGTNICGVALFEDAHLAGAFIVKASQSKNVLTRINQIMEELRWYMVNWNPTDVACETWGGIGIPPARHSSRASRTPAKR